MDYDASEWEPGDLAFITSRNTERTVRILLLHRAGEYEGQRLWWGVGGYIREERITDIERATALTMEELNKRVEVNP